MKAGKLIVELKPSAGTLELIGFAGQIAIDLREALDILGEFDQADPFDCMYCDHNYGDNLDEHFPKCKLNNLLKKYEPKGTT
jgi:hypothetical protein